MWIRYIGISFLHWIGWQMVQAAILLYVRNYIVIQGDALMLTMWASAFIVSFPFAVFAFHVRAPGAKAVLQYGGMHLAVSVLMLFVVGYALFPGLDLLIFSQEMWGQWSVEVLGIIAAAWYVRRRIRSVQGAEGLSA